MAKEILVSVRGRKLTVDLQVEIHTGNQNSLECVFTFDDEWDGLAKTAVFKDANGKSWPTLIADDLCIVPHEATDSGTYFELGIFGVRDGNIVVTTGLCVAELKPGCYTAIAPPSEDIYLQILNEFSTSTARVEAAAQKVQQSADEIKASLPAIHADAETAAQKAAEAVAAAGEAGTARDKAKEYQDAAQESASDALKSAQAASEAEDNISTMQSDIQQLASQVSSDKADVSEKAQTVTQLAQQVEETADSFPEVADAAKSAVTAEGTKQVGLVTAEGTKQIGLVSQEGEDQVAAVNTAGATQTANATAQADRAEEEADRAEAEADRAAAIDAYTKKESRQIFANAFVGEKSGEIVGLSDVCENTTFRKGVIQGVTTEALVNPEADKSPDNIATISGAEPTKLTTCGKNLITFTPATTSRNGLTCVRKADGTITLDGTWEYDDSGYKGTDFTIMVFAKLKPGTYFLSGGPAGGSVNTYNITLRLDNPNASYRYFQDYGSGCLVTINEGDTTQIWVRVIDQIGTVHLTFRPQLEVATSATPFEPYTGTDYTLPAIEEPLMSLSNGVCDEYDLVSGVETRKIGKLTLNGTENWNILSDQCNETSSFFYLGGIAMGSDTVGCTHLICRPIVSDSTSYTNDGIYGNAVGGSLYIRLNNSHNITTAEGLKSWLAAQETAGTPVTVYYELQTSTTTQHDPEEIPVIYPTTTVFADDGKVSVSYNRDSNKVIEQITLDYIEQITALDARIAQLEIGG